MTLRVLAIGDVGNIMSTLQKYTKAEIHIINFFKDVNFDKELDLNLM